MPKLRVTMTLSSAVLVETGLRGENVSKAVNDGLARYYYLLKRARVELRAKLSAREVALICDACNGTLWQAYSLSLLPAEIEDSLEDGLAAKWEVDGPALVEKLRGLDLLELAALVDAVERFWGGPFRQENPDFGAVLA